MRPTMTDDELKERERLNEISLHAMYFMAACAKKSIGGGAKVYEKDPKTVCNHIKWLAHFTGKRLLERVNPGQPMELTADGEMLMDELDEDYDSTIKKLDANRKNNVFPSKYIETIRQLSGSRET